MSISSSDAPGSSISRLERFDSVDSTQRIVAEWLAAGVAEVCVAVADHQAQGVGRMGRTWIADPGRALLASVGFRPTDLAVPQGWRLAAIVSMAMVDAAMGLLGPTADRFALKWPNDIVAVHHDRLLKLGGVVADVATEGDRVATSVVGVGINVDWPKARFPAELASAMWSLSEATGGRRVDREALLQGWLARLESSYRALGEGGFNSERWMSLQITTGCEVSVERGEDTVRGIAVGVDDESGALLVRSQPGDTLVRVAHGEVVHCRVGGSSGPL